MAFPVPSISQGAAESASDTTVTVTVPAVASGDLMVVLMARDGGTGTETWDGPTWDAFGTRETSGSVTMDLRKRKIDGTEGWGSGGSFTITLSVSEAATVTVLVVPASGWSGTLSEVEITTGPSGTDAAPNPPSHNPTPTGDNLLVAYCGYDLGTITISAYPTNYADNQTNHRGGNSAGTGIGLATRNLAGGAAEDPGTFTMSAADGWHAGTFSIPPASAAAQQDLIRSRQMPQLLAN